MRNKIECPFCRNATVEYRDTNDGLVAPACYSCNKAYSREYGRYHEKYDQYGYSGRTNPNRGNPSMDPEWYSAPIKVDPAHFAQLKEQNEIQAALLVEKKAAAERHKAAEERQNLLKLLKETGLDQPLD